MTAACMHVLFDVNVYFDFLSIVNALRHVVIILLQLVATILRKISSLTSSAVSCEDQFSERVHWEGCPALFEWLK